MLDTNIVAGLSLAVMTAGVIVWFFGTLTVKAVNKK